MAMCSEHYFLYPPFFFGFAMCFELMHVSAHTLCCVLCVRLWFVFFPPLVCVRRVYAAALIVFPTLFSLSSFFLWAHAVF